MCTVGRGVDEQKLKSGNNKWSSNDGLAELRKEEFILRRGGYIKSSTIPLLVLGVHCWSLEIKPSLDLNRRSHERSLNTPLL